MSRHRFVVVQQVRVVAGQTEVDEAIGRQRHHAEIGIHGKFEELKKNVGKKLN
jgi:hypothetical protein